MVRRARIWCLLFSAVSLSWLVLGCSGVSQNQTAYQNTTQPTVRSSAWPTIPGLAGHAARLDVQPHEATNPVRTQHLLIATLTDGAGAPFHSGRVEWMLEGTGHIVEVDDEGGLFSSHGSKVSDKYAVSYTASSDRRISRGTGNPNDDFVIHPGQTWCVITSATEGDSNVTVYAPDIANWNLHKVYAVKHWVDAEWTLPPAAVTRVGTEQAFTTQVFRHTDRQPLAKYRVRYHILDGPPALFLPSQAQEVVAVSDLNGSASAKLAQLRPAAGINHISIEIIRPPDPLSTSGVGIVVGKGDTTLEWQAPQVTLQMAGPAQTAINAEVPYSITAANIGKVECREMTVHDTIPDGLGYVRSEPSAIVDGPRLTWTLAGLPAGGSHVLHVYLKATKLGTVTNAASVVTADGLKADSQAVTQVAEPKLTVTKTAPADGVVGVPITYTITVTNPGTGPATNVVLHDEFDKDGLEHASKANPVEMRLGELGAGVSRTVQLTLTPRRAGALASMVTATADGALKATAQRLVTVRVAKLGLSMTGPRARYADRPAHFEITVTNLGQATLNNVIVRDVLPPELGYVKAGSPGQMVPAAGPSTPAVVVWNVGVLQAGDNKTVTLDTKCLTLAPRVVNTASATAEPGQQAQAQAILEVRGLPAYRLEVHDTDDPIAVGSRTTYNMDVTNQGSLPGNGIALEADVPPQMRIVDARGPAAARVQGQHITFGTVDALPPKQQLHYTVTVQAIQTGDLRFHAELRSATLQKPVIKEESTIVIDPNVPPPAATSREPPAGPPASSR